MATTTYAAIRDQYVTVIQALTPTHLPDKPFRRQVRRVTLDERKEQNATAGILRCFEIRRSEGGEEVPFQDPSQFEVREVFECVVVYPRLPELYGDAGTAGLDKLETVMEQDADQIRDALFSSGNYLAGHNLTNVRSIQFDISDADLWATVITAEIYYYKAQSL